MTDLRSLTADSIGGGSAVFTGPYKPRPPVCHQCSAEVKPGTFYSVTHSHYWGDDPQIGYCPGTSYLFCGLDCLRAWAESYDKVRVG